MKSAATHVEPARQAPPVGPSVFEHMVRVADRLSEIRRAPAEADRTCGAFASGSNRTEQVLALVADAGSIPTADLAKAMRVHTKVIWGLLKTPRDIGRVRFEDGMWSVDEAYLESGGDLAVQKAAALLRSKGWFLEPPAN